jgi:hypothetical protein
MKFLLVLVIAISLMIFNLTALSSINYGFNFSKILLADEKSMDIPTYNDSGDVIYGKMDIEKDKSENDISDPFLTDNEY